MPETTRCPECGSLLRVPAQFSAGAEVKCPKCGLQFPLPRPDAAPADSPRPKETEHEGDYSDRPRPAPARREDDEAEGEYAEEGRLPRPGRRARGDAYDEDGDDEPYDRDERRGRVGLAGLSNDYAIDLKEWFRYAKAHWGAVIGPMIGYWFIVQSLSLGAQFVPLAGGCLQALFGPALQAGYTAVALAQLKGRPWTFGDFFAGFRQFGTFFVYTVIAGVYMALAAAPAAAAILVAINTTDGDTRVAAAVLAAPFSMTAFYLWVRIGTFGVPLILDRGCGATEAIKGSWTLTRGHGWGLLGVWSFFLLINLGGLLLLPRQTHFNCLKTQGVVPSTECSSPPASV